MGVISRWRYRILFAFAMVYMAVSCIVACALLWNTSVTRLPSPAEIIDTSEHNSLVPACNTSKDLLDDPLLDCSLLDRLSYEKFIAHGWTKIVHKAKLDDGASIAIKTVNINGKDVNDCSRAETLIVCHNKATEKLVREIQLLKKLNHENIIQLKHYCSKIEGADGCMKYAVIGTEIGETLSNLKLLQMTWRERKQVIQDLIRLIHYSSTLSPLGTLGLADLRRPQFILVKGRLKLADLDDIIIGEPTCSSISDCSGLLFFIIKNSL